MQHLRHALRPHENGNEPSRRVAVISTAMPVSASLQESLSSLERVARPVLGELNSHNALEELMGAEPIKQ
jgi:hypothetical protein